MLLQIQTCIYQQTPANTGRPAISASIDYVGSVYPSYIASIASSTTGFRSPGPRFAPVCSQGFITPCELFLGFLLGVVLINSFVHMASYDDIHVLTGTRIPYHATSRQRLAQVTADAL